MRNRREIKALDWVSKVEFCQMARISRPTLYKYLRGEDVIPALEDAILRTAARLESQAEPAPA